METTSRLRRTAEVYTVLRTLCLMRKKQGLERMLEYIESYVKAVEDLHPEIPLCVNEVLLEKGLDAIMNTKEVR